MDLVGEIRRAVLAGQFLVSRHARQRLAARKIRLWQIEAGVTEGKVLRVDEDSEPNPTIVLEQLLPDGTPLHVVWVWLSMSREALLVTAITPETGEDS